MNNTYASIYWFKMSIFNFEKKSWINVNPLATHVSKVHTIAEISNKENFINARFPAFLFRLCPECSATGMGQFPICKLKSDLLRTFVTACTIDRNTFSAPFGIFYVRTEIWKEIFQKKSYTTPLWGEFHLQTTISKRELP